MSVNLNFGVPIEHFLLSTGLSIRVAGNFDGEDFNINAILTKGGKPAELRNGHLLSSAVGFARSERNRMPSVASAVDELVKEISDQTVWFGDESLKVPKLKTAATKVLRGQSDFVDMREVKIENPSQS